MAPRTRPSLTARNVAKVRLALDRPTLPSGDALGDDRLARSLRSPLPAQLPGLAQYIAARTAFFDRQLLDALEAEVRQVVIVAAGYDGRSVRFRHPGVRYFEIDHPATQQDKRERLDDLGVDASDVTFCAADLGVDRANDVLARAGHDAAHATHFMCEGLTSYLPMPDLRVLLESLAAGAATGSSLAIDFAVPGHARALLSQMMLVAVRTGTALMGERIVTLLTEDQATALLESAGWSRVQLDANVGSFPVLFVRARI